MEEAKSEIIINNNESDNNNVVENKVNNEGEKGNISVKAKVKKEEDNNNKKEDNYETNEENRISKRRKKYQKSKQRAKKQKLEEREGEGEKETELKTEENKEKEVTERGDSNAATRKRNPKYKVAVLLGFNGEKYQGMQINPGCESIEKQLQEGFFKAGAISEYNKDQLNKVCWQRCARTDKGVHAVGQIVSFKMEWDDPDTMVQRMNDNLPADIRVFAFVRSTTGFDAKKNCNGRTYEYNIPSYAFRPSKLHPNYNSELNYRDYRIDESTLAKVREVLGKYMGTHSFHNFTSGIEFGDKKACRFITSFTSEDPFITHDIEYLRLRVVGQSFILNQIRKMVAMTVCVVRDNAPVEVLESAFLMPNIRLPMVPGHGLLLLKCHFDYYEKQRGKDREPLTFLQYQDAIQAFKMSQIYENMFLLEKNQNLTEEWLINLEEYPLNYEEMIEFYNKEKDNILERQARRERKKAYYGKK